MRKVKLLGNDDKLLKLSLDTKTFAFQLLDGDDPFVIGDTDICKAVIINNKDEVVFHSELTIEDRKNGIVLLTLNDYISSGLFQLEFVIINNDLHLTFAEENDLTLIVRKNLSDRPQCNISDKVKNDYDIIIAEIEKVDLAFREFKINQLSVNGVLESRIDALEALEEADILEVYGAIRAAKNELQSEIDSKLGKEEIQFLSNAEITEIFNNQ